VAFIVVSFGTAVQQYSAASENIGKREKVRDWPKTYYFHYAIPL